MSLISYYPLNGNGKDVLGNGPTVSIVYTTFNGETVGAENAIFNIIPLDSDFTISYDLYRRGFTADWCIDCGFDIPYWGTGTQESKSTFKFGYMQNYGQDKLEIIDSNSYVVLNIPNSVTIGKWYHTEVHRKDKEIITYINGIECPHYFVEKVVTFDHIYFFNAGGNQTGGGYFKNIRIYDTYMTESIVYYNNLYNNDENVYDITKNNSST